MAIMSLDRDISFSLAVVYIVPPLIAAYLVIAAVYNHFFHPLARFPGPFFASISHWWLIWQAFRRRPIVKMRQLHEKHGPIVRIKPNELSIADPEAIKTIYGINAGFDKPDFYLGWRAGIGKYPDLFTQLNEGEHAQRRRIVNNLYSLSSIARSEGYIDNCIDMFCTRMDEYAEKEEIVNIAKWAQWYAFDVIGELFFGRMFGFMRDKHDYRNWIAGIDRLVPIVSLSTLMPMSWRPILMLSGILVPSIKRASEAFKNVADEARSAANERERMIEAGEKPRQDIVASLFDIMNEKGEKLDFGMDDIKTEIWVGLLAGSDTTAAALSATLYYVLKNHTIYKRLLEEVLQADRQGQLSRPIVRYGEASNLSYLNACIKEAMRVHPSVGWNLPRLVPRKGCEIAGHWIPGGNIVSINANVVHADKTVFGEDANQFNPERWLTGNAKNMDHYSFQFGHGSRGCIGKSISLVEIYKLVPQLLRSYHIELAAPNESWKAENYWFHKVYEIRIRIQKR